MSLRIIHIPRVESTNLEAAARLARNEISDSTFIYTDYQDHGKGRGTHAWHSEPGLNLLLSWILFPAFLSVDRQFLLSKMVSVSIARTLGKLGLSVRIKWPNDILVAQRKIGGILIENSIIGTRIRWSIAGIGLNLNQEVFPEFEREATSYYNETGKKVSVKDVLPDLAACLEEEFDNLKSGLTDSLDAAYLEYLYCMNGAAEFVSGDRLFEGKIRGVSSIGELLVEHSGTVSEYGMHELQMIT